jgi:hypothetical protein
MGLQVIFCPLLMRPALDVLKVCLLLDIFEEKPDDGAQPVLA